MRLLYLKYANKRKKEFQIKVGIYEKDGTRIVYKTPIYEEGIQHIKNILNNSLLAVGLYGKHSSQVNLDGKTLIYPFYNGESLGHKLCQAFRQEDGDVISHYFELWRKIVSGGQNNLIKFHTTEQFENVFGDGQKFINLPATKLSNCDCSCENIIFQNENEYKIIDYEWMFSFPVPLEFLWYRVVKYFMVANELSINKNRVLRYAKINFELAEACEELENHFIRYISYDPELNINYTNIASQFYRYTDEDIEKSMIKEHYKPDIELPSGSSICLYGAGKVGGDFYRYFKQSESYKLLAWTDKRASLYIKQGMDLISVDELKKIDFDYIVVAVLQEQMANEIMCELKEMGISENKIYWKKPLWRL